MSKEQFHLHLYEQSVIPTCTCIHVEKERKLSTCMCTLYMNIYMYFRLNNYTFLIFTLGLVAGGLLSASAGGLGPVVAGGLLSASAGGLGPVVAGGLLSASAGGLGPVVAGGLLPALDG